MIIPITKEDFEQHLPVGISAHESLFEKIEPSIEYIEEDASDKILGKAGMAMVEDNTKAALRSTWVRYICITAFLSVLRQLDLVLTPTGFGVISSDKYAPASKMRVDALEGQLRNTQIKAYARLLDMLRSPEWGVTEQAVQCIPYIYNEMCFFHSMNVQRDYKDWMDWQSDIERADIILREKISSEQMDAVVNAYRCRDDKYIVLAGNLRKFTDCLHYQGEHEARSSVLPLIIRILETNLDKYTEWAHSKEYDAFHHEGFKNSRDSSAYVFG